MNTRGQIDNPMILFAVLVIGLLLFAPIGLKIMKEVQEPLSSSLGNVSNGGEVAQANFDRVLLTGGINLWDKVMIAAFGFTVIMLLVSAFMVDAHPFFLIIYIALNLMLVLFAPNIIEAVDNIYDSPQFAEEAALLTFMDTLRVYYAEFLVGMMILTGIIIYGKISLTNGRRGIR